MVDDEVTSEVTVNEGDDEEGDDDEEEEQDEESLTDFSGEASDSHSEEEEGSDVDNEVDEEFRKEIKMALGDAALPTSEVCYYILQTLIDLATMLSQLCNVRLISLMTGNYSNQLEGITLVVFHLMAQFSLVISAL